MLAKIIFMSFMLNIKGDLVMKIAKIQNNSFTPKFGAKLDINGEIFFGEVKDKMLEKASKIGTDKDIIDIRYVGYYVNKSQDKFKGTFVAKFLPKGQKSGIEKVKQDINDTTRYAYREKAKAAAQKYVDDLFNKYTK